MGLSVLHDLIVDEEIYISIYTKNFPNNEIREDSWSELTVIFQVGLIVFTLMKYLRTISKILKI
jgi:hypothetical protein